MNTSVGAGYDSNNRCLKCQRDFYDCLCNGDNAIPREARTPLPLPVKSGAVTYVASRQLIYTEITCTA